MDAASPQPIRSICVYCGSSPGGDPAFAEAAAELGRRFAAAGIRLVYGGGDNGLMGAVAQGVLSGNGAVTGIIPTFLLDKEQAQRPDWMENADIQVVPDMHTRKHRMFEEADAFVALPGGIGTLEELVEVLTWAQLRRHSKPIMVLNINGFWDPLKELIDHMETAGFLHNAASARPRLYTSVDELLSAVHATKA